MGWKAGGRGSGPSAGPRRARVRRGLPPRAAGVSRSSRAARSRNAVSRRERRDGRDGAQSSRGGIEPPRRRFGRRGPERGDVRNGWASEGGGERGKGEGGRGEGERGGCKGVTKRSWTSRFGDRRRPAFAEQIVAHVRRATLRFESTIQRKARKGAKAAKGGGRRRGLGGGARAPCARYAEREGKGGEADGRGGGRGAEGRRGEGRAG